MTLQKYLVGGMEVDEAKAAHKVAHAGGTYYFCPEECLATFKRLAKVFSKDALDSISPTRFMES